MTDPADQVAYRRLDEVTDETPDVVSHTEIYEGELEAGAEPESGIESLDELTSLDLRSDETDDQMVASEQGVPYVPPTDPPVVPSIENEQGIEIAAGFGSTALDEPYDEDHVASALSEESDLTARIREALRADATTSRYADDLVIGTRGGTVVIRGRVEDLVDTDDVVAVAERVTGVTEVVEELEVSALE